MKAVAERIRNARYLLLPTGHYAPLQTPEPLSAAILEFLAAAEAAA